MSNQKLAGIIAACTVAIIVAILLIHFEPWKPPLPPESHTLTTVVSPSGAGSVSPSGSEYASGVNVTLTATPANGFTFDCWGGAASGTSATITIAMDSDKSLTANFKSTTQMYTLTTSINPSAAGSVSPSGGEYESGDNITLTATPATACTFDHWSGASSSTASTVTITMDSDKSLTANFKTVPSVTIALDYFGIRNTGWMEQVGGDDKAKIQLVVLIRDERGPLATFAIPEAGVEGWYMDFFQVEALEDHGDPGVFTCTPIGHLTWSVSAWNVNKGPITKAQIDWISAWTGTDWSAIRNWVPDRELVGSCWYTWSASRGFGVGENYESDDGNLKVWLRVGSCETMPEPVPRPVLEPNVEIVGKLPTDVKARTQVYYHQESFTFTLTNHESFAFPIYWRLETDSNPGTKINFIICLTEDWVTVQGGSSTTVTYRYWFTTPGEYEWKYVAEYPKGTPIASWQGTLTVAPPPRDPSPPTCPKGR